MSCYRLQVAGYKLPVSCRCFIAANFQGFKNQQPATGNQQPLDHHQATASQVTVVHATGNLETAIRK